MLKDKKTNIGEGRFIGLELYKKFLSLSDISAFTSMLKGAYQDVLGIKGSERRIKEPVVIQISYKSPLTIVIDPWVMLIVGLGLTTKWVIENYSNIKEIFQDLKKSKFTKIIAKRAKRWAKKQEELGGEKILEEIKIFIVIIKDNKTIERTGVSVLKKETTFHKNKW